MYQRKNTCSSILQIIYSTKIDYVISLIVNSNNFYQLEPPGK